MPLFNNKGTMSKKVSPTSSLSDGPVSDSDDNAVEVGQPPSYQQPLPQFVFHCQLAHGSSTCSISGFANMKQLYDKIAKSFAIETSDILYCTLNTHKLDMSKLLGGQIGLNDFIFVHLKGLPKEIEVKKSQDFLGLTITDNGNGYSFIKKIKEGSLIDNTKFLKAGDHIEKVNGEDMTGKRHFEVARALKEVPLASSFILRVIEPLQAGFAQISARSSRKSTGNLKSGRETLRFRNDGQAVVESMVSSLESLAIEKMNGLLESYMGINDGQLANQIWEFGKEMKNPHDLASRIDNSDLETFGFADDIIFDFWGVITDYRAGRLK